MRPNKTVFEGVVYKSLGEAAGAAAQFSGISRKEIYSRCINKNETPEKALFYILNIKPVEKTNGISTEFNGVTYPTKKQACEALAAKVGLSWQTAYAHISRKQITLDEFFKVKTEIRVASTLSTRAWV